MNFVFCSRGQRKTDLLNSQAGESASRALRSWEEIWKAVPSPESESTQERKGFPALVLFSSKSWSLGMKFDRAVIVVRSGPATRR